MLTRNQIEIPSMDSGFLMLWMAKGWGQASGHGSKVNLWQNVDERDYPEIWTHSTGSVLIGASCLTNFKKILFLYNNSNSEGRRLNEKSSLIL